MSAKSYTQVSMYEKCPQQYNFRYKEHLPRAREQSPAAARGSLIHKSIEDFMNDEKPAVHPEIESYQEWLGELKEDPTSIPEYEFCISSDWELLEWDDPNGYFRGYMDLKLQEDTHGFVYEFKTGKKYPDHAQQMHIYATVELSLNDHLEDVTSTAVYLDKHETKEIVYMQAMNNTAKYFWSRRIDKLEHDKIYAPRPGPYCRWCDFGKDKGGPCAFGG
jgi:CRISPR/Cas system-associated exonuclease Cas4 (RecB family)